VNSLGFWTHTFDKNIVAMLHLNISNNGDLPTEKICFIKNQKLQKIVQRRTNYK
jgi:hypothetical protein